MLYLYSFVNLSSVILENDLRQKMIASSTESPIPCDAITKVSGTLPSLHLSLDSDKVLEKDEPSKIDCTVVALRA